MRGSKKLKAIYLGQVMTILLAGLCLLVVSGCAKDSVVVLPVAVKPVDQRLMQRIYRPDCEPKLSEQEKADGEISPIKIGASARCWKAGEARARTRLHGLQKAVKARQEATGGI